MTDPFGNSSAGHGLIDQLRAAKTITGCEVPLAVLYWTATDGIVFVDMWTVRRPLVSRDLLEQWAPGAGRRRAIDGLAMFLQFQQQASDLIQDPAINPLSVKVTDNFLYLPAAGFIPIGNVHPGIGFDYLQFLSGRTYRNPVFMEGARVERLIRTAVKLGYGGVMDIVAGAFQTVYFDQLRAQIRKLARLAHAGVNPPQLYMLFANGHIPFQGDSEYDLSYWDYANYV